MITWALIPVKSFRLGKSRLQEVLSARELYELNRKLFTKTLASVQKSGSFSHIMVISEDEEALGWASEQGVNTFVEGHSGDLNNALRQALAAIHGNGSGSVMVIPTDLPMLTVEDLNLAAGFVPEHNGILLVPDHRMSGTNALFFSKPDLMPTAFGIDSFALHCAMAEDRHLKQVIYLNSHIQHDLDTPEDLSAFRECLD